MMDEALNVLRGAVREARREFDHETRMADELERSAAEHRTWAENCARVLADCEAALRALSLQSITISAGER